MKTKSPATKAPSPATKAPTIRDVIAYIRASKLAQRTAWIDMVNAETMHALEWARSGVEATIVVDTCDHALRALDNGADLEAHALAQALRLGAFPPASTGLLDAEINAYRVAAWIRIADEAKQAAKP